MHTIQVLHVHGVFWEVAPFYLGEPCPKLIHWVFTLVMSFTVSASSLIFCDKWGVNTVDLSIFQTAFKSYLIYGVLPSNTDYRFCLFKLCLQWAVWSGPHQDNISHVYCAPHHLYSQHTRGRLHWWREVRREKECLASWCMGCWTCSLYLNFGWFG